MKRIVMLAVILIAIFSMMSTTALAVDEPITLNIERVNSFSSTNDIFAWCSNDANATVETQYAGVAGAKTFELFYKVLLTYDYETEMFVVTDTEGMGSGANRYETEWNLGYANLIIMAHDTNTNQDEFNIVKNMQVGDSFYFGYTNYDYDTCIYTNGLVDAYLTTEKPVNPWVPSKIITSSGIVLESDAEKTHYTVTDYVGTINEITIPSDFNGVPVQYIGYRAFADCTTLTKVVIPDSVTEIGDYAFEDCTSLKAVDLSKSLTYLGCQVFTRTAIEEIEIPKKLTKCGYTYWYGHTYNGVYYSIFSVGPFAACENLKKVTFEAGTTEVANALFAGCTGLETITIPNTVTIIESNAFVHCLNLKTVTISESATEIGKSAFGNCVSLTAVTIPDSVTKIGDYAFEDCTSLKAVDLSKSLTYLGRQVFTRTAIEEIEIPKKLTECVYTYWDGYTYNGVYYSVFSVGPFAECENLKKVTFEAGTTEVANALFAGCTGLETITIPNTVTIIESNAFRSCLNLKTVTLSESATEIGKYAFGNCVSLTAVTIPDSVTKIGDSAFEDCTSLKAVDLSKSLTYLACQVFTHTAIEEIEIPKKLTECGYTYWYDHTYNGVYYLMFCVGPFAECENLKKVTFEAGTTEVVNALFAGCPGLETITIPNTVTIIESNAFENCLNLKSVTISESATEIGKSAFESCVSLTVVTIPDSVTKIGEYAFEGCTSLIRVSISDSVTEIGQSAFIRCASLEDIKLPKYITLIRERTFENCDSLKTISLPANITDIYQYAFAECDFLEELIIPEQTKSIGTRAFYNCDSLVKVYLPQSLRTLSNGAFENCDVLSDITISDYSIKTIEANTFKSCPAIKKIVLSKGLETIKSQAFMNDTALTEVVVPESVTSIDSTAFSYPTKTTISGKTGSYAETFANDGGFTFKDISIPVEGIILKDGVENVTLDQGETYRAEFEVYPEDANDVVTLTANNSNVTIDGHDIYARYSGDTVITATSSSGLTYEFNLHIRSVKNIAVVNDPNKTTYVLGEEFDKTGMIVQVNYNDGSSRLVEDYTITGFDSSVEGDCDITVKWLSANGYSYSDSFTVTIIDNRPKITGIVIDKLPDKVEYARKQSLDLTGMVVNATYDNGMSASVEGYTVSGYNALKQGEQTITVTYEGFTATFTVTVHEEGWTPPVVEPEYVVGDLNGDGEIKTNDYTTLKRVVMGTYVLSDELIPAADINSDGEVKTNDYTALKRVVMGTLILTIN